MRKKLTITVDAQVYEGLHRVVGRGRISQFVEALVRPHVIDSELDAGYRLMAADEQGEAEAIEWIEATVADCADDPR